MGCYVVVYHCRTYVKAVRGGGSEERGRVTPIGGPGTRGLERADKHCMQSPGKQREPNGALHAKDDMRGGIECAPGLVL